MATRSTTLIETPNVTALCLDDAVSEHLIDLSSHSWFAMTRAMGESYYGKFEECRSIGWLVDSKR